MAGMAKAVKKGAAAQLAASSAANAATEFAEIKLFLETLNTLLLEGGAQAQQDAAPSGLLNALLAAKGNSRDAELTTFARLVTELNVPSNCLDWWRDNGENMPNLSGLARSTSPASRARSSPSRPPRRRPSASSRLPASS